MREVAPEELREQPRRVMALEGQIFLAEDGSQTPCRLTDISEAGAGIVCGRTFRFGSRLVLYTEAFGRQACVPVAHEDGGMGLYFLDGEAGRQMLAAALAGGRASCAAPPRLRRQARSPASGQTRITRPLGSQLPCEMLDSSAMGLSLGTLQRPPLGEIVRVGGSRGRVVRHHPAGIAVQMMQLIED